MDFRSLEPKLSYLLNSFRDIFEVPSYLFCIFKVQELFIQDYGEIFTVQLPGKEERTKFFEDLILKQAAKPPVSKKKAG